MTVPKGKVPITTKGSGGKKVDKKVEKKAKVPVPLKQELMLDEEERIQKLIARSGLASRRDAEKMVRTVVL